MAIQMIVSQLVFFERSSLQHSCSRQHLPSIFLLILQMNNKHNLKISFNDDFNDWLVVISLGQYNSSSRGH